MTTAIIVCIIAVTAIAFFINRPTERHPKTTLPQNQKTFLDAVDSNDNALRTEGDVKDLFYKNGLSIHWDFFKSYLKPEILIFPKPSNELELKVGESKIGGQPDLPKNIEWFTEDNGKHLSFIAQVNLVEIAGLDNSQQLPPQGILYFFYSAEQEAWGFDVKDKDKFKVFYYEGSIEELKRIDFPKNLIEHARYKPCKLTFKASVSLPNWEHDYVFDRLNSQERHKYTDITEELDVKANKLLGHSDNIQEPMELECELVTNGLYTGDPKGYNDPRAKELEKNKDAWTLLLQVDSNYEESGMMWGDAGMLYFWIKKDDLKNKKFDKSWLISQCY